MGKGLFITFDGTEGAGKTTQFRLLATRLTDAGYNCVTVREPGGTDIGEKLRTILKDPFNKHTMTPEAELLLFCAARAQLVCERIRPLLEQGCVVLCDRFVDSTLAYQGYGRELDGPFVERLLEFCVGGTVPDRTYFLRVPRGICLERLGRRGGTDRMEQESEAFFQRVQQGFDEIARSSAGQRIRTLDGTFSETAIAAWVWQEVQRLIAGKNIQKQPSNPGRAA